MASFVLYAMTIMGPNDKAKMVILYNFCSTGEIVDVRDIGILYV